VAEHQQLFTTKLTAQQQNDANYTIQRLYSQHSCTSYGILTSNATLVWNC